MNETTRPAAGGRLWVVLKLVTIGALGLLLLIPVVQVLGLVRERQQREREVQIELGRQWGGEQTVGALLLAVPLRPAPESQAASKGSAVVATEWLHFLPAEVRWRGSLQPQLRRRGLFEVTLYEARLAASGWFRRPDTGLLGVTAERLIWDRAVAVLALADPRGLVQRPELRWGGSRHSFVPGQGPLGALPGGVQAALGGAALDGERLPFTLELTLRGSRTLRLLPLAEVTSFTLTAPWPDPSFIGAPLPAQRQVSTRGFSAAWEVPYFARQLPQQWRSGDPAVDLGEGLTGAAFGVSLVRPANPYQQVERAVKYAALFIALTFTTVFLLELLSPLRLHPVNYLLVGLALCLFYLLLLALAEHLGMGPAYALATAATVTLITLYASAVLAGAARAAVLGAALGGLYGWLYTLLRAEELALLLGAAGLFAVLAGVMFLTRRLDWSTLRFRAPPAGA